MKLEEAIRQIVVEELTRSRVRKVLEASRGQVAGKVAARKKARPDLYCSKCLWMTGGGDCPRHGGPEWTKEREAAALAKSRGDGGESTD